MLRAVTRARLAWGALVLLAAAAGLALVVGGAVGRKIVPGPAPTKRVPPTVRFADTLTDVAVSYPATWRRRSPADQAVRLVAASPDESAGVSISVRKSGLEPITARTLPVVRSLTDDLLRADPRINGVPTPVAVTLDGLPGYRYQYTYRTRDGGDGAHVHYFLFEDRRLIQLVLQAMPAARLAQEQPTFRGIAGTFRADGG